LQWLWLWVVCVAIASVLREEQLSSATTFGLLNWWALYCPIGAKHATITLFWF